MVPARLSETDDYTEKMANSVKLKPNQPARRYIGIDVTKALDTIAWGHIWNATFGWRNLLWELDRDSADSQARVDKAHPKIPIRRLIRTRKKSTFADSCIMPQGIDGSGSTATLTDADIDAACNFMHTFILSPGADKAKSELNDTGSGVVADIVYLSSHGLFTGDMFGTGSFLTNLFEPSKIANSGGQFSGPSWLILSNCSTLDPSTHGDWLKLMTGSNPLRGIVGFQHACPLEGGSVDFVGAFVRRLALGKTFLQAWNQAVTTIVSGDNWIVVCHENAKDDTIADWNANKLKAIPATSKVLMFDKSNLAGKQVVIPSDPFEAFWSKGGTRITAVNKGDLANRLQAGDTVVVTIRPPTPAPATPPPPPATFTSGNVIAITLVYIRTDYPQNIDVTKMFSVVGQTGASAPTTADLNPSSPGGDDSWKLVVTGTPTEVTLTLRCTDLSMLHDSGMPLWLRVDIGTQKHDFIRNGSIVEKK
jgi:hypothetical protein